MSGRRWAATVTGLAMTAALTACGDGDDASDADLSSADAGRTPVTETTDDEELRDYSADEKAAYEDAVVAVKRALRVDFRVYREGKATPAARRALASVYTGAELENEWEALRDMEADGGRFAGSVKVLRVKPMRVLVSDDEGTVDLRVCLDRSKVEVFKRGEGEVTPPDLATAKAFKITLDRESDGTWRVADSGEGLGKC